MQLIRLAGSSTLALSARNFVDSGALRSAVISAPRQTNGRTLAVYPDRVQHLLERAFVALEVAVRCGENEEQQALGALHGD